METEEVESAQRSSLYNKTLKRFFRNKISYIGLTIVSVIILVAIFCPYLAPYNPKKQFWGEEWAPPSRKFIFGTDDLGRDVYSRVLWGARTSLMVGLVSVTIIVILGTVVGSIAGYFGGIIDQIIMRAECFCSLFLYAISFL